MSNPLYFTPELSEPIIPLVGEPYFMRDTGFTVISEPDTGKPNEYLRKKILKYWEELKG